MCLAALWLAIGDRIPTPQQANGVLEIIYRTLTALGAASALASLTFLAYVLGTLLMPLTEVMDGAISWVDFKVVRSFSSIESPGIVGRDTWMRLGTFAREEVRDLLEQDRDLTQLKRAFRRVDEPTGAAFIRRPGDRDDPYKAQEELARTLALRLSTPAVDRLILIGCEGRPPRDHRQV